MAREINAGLPDFDTWASPPRRQGILNIFRPDPDGAGVDLTIEQRMAGGLVQFVHADGPNGYFRIPLNRIVPIEVGTFVYVLRPWGTPPCFIALMNADGSDRVLPLDVGGFIMMVKTGTDQWRWIQFRQQ
ncbi:MAG: hypothetical protein DI530_12250 [Sphingomonas sp.]|uniref:hypothetical protein n=1 Tax=Sphingomonas sp. TaxID=28214 RepID=UPI000DBBB226|nr:hypothetical protein [Sphingomonas sp.]PZU77756.1 MAG: hypothetical protein DI530_12250 [Sphingomonas sp.]